MKNTVANLSTMVSGITSPMIFDTDSSCSKDWPKSPLSSPPSQPKYCM